MVIPAFPEAVGYGAASIGGRGGRVIEVTNLNNSGPGSFRDAVQNQSGRRIVVFRVAGEIFVTGSRIRIVNPFLTIAGQTAPGSGITLRSSTCDVRPLINFENASSGNPPHDIIMRYIKIRPGLGDCSPGQEGFTRDGLTIRSGFNIILDHISGQWATDEIMSISPEFPDTVYNVTIQNSIIGESLLSGKGFLATTTLSNVSRITLYHNLLAHANTRNPRVGSTETQIINNVVYNWGSRAGGTSFGPDVDYIGNYLKAGPWSNQSSILRHEIVSSKLRGRSGIASIHIENNLAIPFQPNPNADNWNLITFLRDESGGFSEGDLLPLSWRRSTPLSPPIAVPNESAQAAFDSVVADVGDNARLDENGNLIGRLDVIDQSVISDTINGTAPNSNATRNSPADYGGYPTPIPGTLYADTNGDGIADVWAAANPGGTIEEFLNGSAVASPPPPPPPPPPPSPEPAVGVTIWDNATVPSQTDADTGAVELGVKFRSSTNGFITGLRFYKSPANTGPHTGNLWTSTGTPLASVTFSSETPSGWQQVALPTPVAITANTTYVASYHTTVGRYSTDPNYFAASDFANPPLTALQDGFDGPNSVYSYGSTSSFPDLTWQSANYWVDVVFDTAEPPPPSLPPIAAFSASPISGNIPLNVQFINSSSNGDSWLWDFGDGVTSTVQDPLHTYTVSGVYTVTLQVTGLGGIDVQTQSGLIAATDYLTITWDLPNQSATVGGVAHLELFNGMQLLEVGPDINVPPLTTVVLSMLYIIDLPTGNFILTIKMMDVTPGYPDIQLKVFDIPLTVGPAPALVAVDSPNWTRS